MESAIIWCSYKTNFSSAPQLVAKVEGKIVALAELNTPDYKAPSVLSYILHGWLRVYMVAGLKRGYEVFDEQVFEYNDNKMGSWSMKKVL